MSTDDMKANRLIRGRQSSIDGGTSIGMRQKDQSQESQMTEDGDFFHYKIYFLKKYRKKVI